MFKIDGEIGEQTLYYSSNETYKKMCQEFNSRLRKEDYEAGIRNIEILEGEKICVCCKLKATKELIDMVHIVYPKQNPSYLFMTEKEPIFYVGYYKESDVIILQSCFEYISKDCRKPQEGYFETKIFEGNMKNSLKKLMLKQKKKFLFW